MNAPALFSHPTDPWTTGANCWATAPPSPPCWTACCTTDTCSSAARAVGGPKAAVRRKANDKSKGKCKKRYGSRAKAARRRRDSGSRSLDAGASPSESLQKHETLWQASPSGQPHRVSITDSFGASPVSSALDHPARRDPGEANTTLPRIQKAWESAITVTTQIAPCKSTLRQGKTITSQANPYGRF